MNSAVMMTLTGESTPKAKLINEDDLLSGDPSSLTATIKGIKKAHSLFQGDILYLGYYEGMGTLSVRVSDKEIVRYLNLSDIEVVPGEVVKEGTYLGEVNEQYGLQFEYATQWQGSSNKPIRLADDHKIVTYFKQNPMSLLDGKYTPEYIVAPENGFVDPDDVVELSEEQFYEFSNYVTYAPKVTDSSDYSSIDIIMTEEMAKELSNGKGME